MLKEKISFRLRRIRANNQFKLLRSSNCHVQVTSQTASDLIKAGLLNDKPLLVSRLGFTELKCLIEFLLKKKNKYFFYRYFHYLKGLPYSTQFSNNVKQDMSNFSGFFPTSDDSLNQFCRLMLANISDIDILGSWLNQENLTYSYFGKHVRIGLEDLPPFNFNRPWSEALKGKKVLVVHPFAESIEKQYKKRELLFENTDVLPAFRLITLKSVQTIANNQCDFADWFSALEYMKSQVDSLDFDIAIVGCGAYGLPLASHIKQRGKKAIHLGGVTQCLFGIKGKRWETIYDYEKRFYNKYWIRPNVSEIPMGAHKVEDGCYW